jgi:hypothetical protein
MIRSNLPRALVLAAVLVAPSACSGDGSSTASSTTSPTTSPSSATASSTSPDLPSTTGDGVHLIEVTYAGGQVAGGAQRTTVRLGEKVHLRVTSDMADEVHVHTYDLKANVTPGLPAEIDLVASIPGRHEVELEKKRRLLLTLEVR